MNSLFISDNNLIKVHVVRKAKTLFISILIKSRQLVSSKWSSFQLVFSPTFQMARKKLIRKICLGVGHDFGLFSTIMC